MRSRLYYEVRLHKLVNKDPVANANIIKKVERKLRQFDREENGASNFCIAN